MSAFSLHVCGSLHYASLITRRYCVALACPCIYLKLSLFFIAQILTIVTAIYLLMNFYVMRLVGMNIFLFSPVILIPPTS